MRSWETSRRICPCRNVFVALMKYTVVCIFIQTICTGCQTFFHEIGQRIACARRTANNRVLSWPPGQAGDKKGQLLDTPQCPDDYWIFGSKNVTYQQSSFLGIMSENCHIAGCKHDVPAA